jgi:hypothetical protein
LLRNYNGSRRLLRYGARFAASVTVRGEW